MMPVLFDFAHVPFSRAGRFLTISMMAVPGHPDRRAPYLRHVAGGDERPSLGRLCRMEFLDRAGHPVEPEFTLLPQSLTASTGAGSVTFAIGQGERLHLRGQGLSVRLHLEGSRYDYVYSPPVGGHCLVAAVENVKFVPTAFEGELEVSGTWKRDHSEGVSFSFGSDQEFEGQVIFFRTVAPAPDAVRFSEAVADAKADFDRWHGGFPPAVTGQEETHRLACYLLWANRVPAGGMLTRTAIYMSKNHMINVWSWDNAFSALGIAGADPQLAFDQLAVIFDHQDRSGLLPDYVNDRDVLFAFTKPPVHGWALSLIEHMHPGFLTPERRSYLCHAIGRQVDYWLTHARATADALPSYFHGNDSGWDNASFFAEGGPVLSPDLPVFLILACDALAEHLEDSAEAAAAWRKKADRLLSMLLDQLWNGETFIARLADSGRPLPGESLIQFMPLLLGERLPRAMADSLLERLHKCGFVTRWGPATESPLSSFYEDDGYWRGPIWAPTTLLLWDGLRRQGQADLAHMVAQRFCGLAAENGMAENFDALTGKGLRDRAFAWTSAAYTLLSEALRTNQP